ncbi:MAG: DUF2178 domain-containing protein [Patescibacteria group bacterium]
MSKKQYLICRLVVSFFTALLVASAITLGNYVIPLLVIIAGMVVLYTCRKKVQDVLVDERDYKIAGQASRYVLNAYCLIGAIITVVVFATSKDNAALMLLANFLAYSICLIMIINSLLFKWLSSRK